MFCSCILYVCIAFFMYCFSELLPLSAQFLFSFRWPVNTAWKLIFKEIYHRFSICHKYMGKKMEIHINFKILNERSLSVCSKKMCVIKLIAIYVLYVLNKEALIEIFVRIWSNIILILFSLQNQKKSRKVIKYTNIMMLFYSILLTRPRINIKK